MHLILQVFWGPGLPQRGGTVRHVMNMQANGLRDRLARTACLEVGLGGLLEAACDEEVEDGDDIALVCGHRAPQPLCLARECRRVLPCQHVHAPQQLLAPVPCKPTISL